MKTAGDVAMLFVKTGQQAAAGDGFSDGLLLGLILMKRL